MADTVKTEFRGALLEGDRYLAFLAIVLLGYAVMGKGFAYLGFPPLFVGEIAFISGIIVFLRTGALISALATLPAVLLVAMAALVLARTLPFLDLYGFESLRDSTVVIYGGFAFIVIGLLLEDSRRINIVLHHYRIMLTCLPAILLALLLTKYLPDNIPQLIGTVPIVNTGPTTVGSHLVGTMIFALIGYRKVSVAWVVVWLAALGIVCATSRGAMLAVVLPLAFAMLMLGRLRLMLHIVGVGLAIFAVLLTLESSLGNYSEAKDSWDRSFSAHQIVENAMSIFGQSGNQGEGTKQWREKWWHLIIQDSIHGPNFWTGRGFGLNIAEEDGFSGNTEDRAPLRSPHNVFMTLLARTGVPGLVLWVLVLVSWFGMMMKAILNARACGHKQWSGLFLFIACYAAAFVINATFDVVLEGPVQGIWFWCLFGFGVGSVMIYRAQPFTCSDCSAPQGTQVAPSPTDPRLPL
jgi:hypothetical protein